MIPRAPRLLLLLLLAGCDPPGPRYAAPLPELEPATEAPTPALPEGDIPSIPTREGLAEALPGDVEILEARFRLVATSLEEVEVAIAAPEVPEEGDLASTAGRPASVLAADQAERARRAARLREASERLAREAADLRLATEEARRKAALLKALGAG